MNRLLCAALFLVAIALLPSVCTATDVAVIAPSVSTRMEARAVLARLRWRETTLREAEGILVVVRSMLFNPLDSSYDSIKELQDDAEGQLNISGEVFTFISTASIQISASARSSTRLTKQAIKHTRTSNETQDQRPRAL
jgi:hypothetical protein